MWFTQAPLRQFLLGMADAARRSLAPPPRSTNPLASRWMSFSRTARESASGPHRICLLVMPPTSEWAFVLEPDKRDARRAAWTWAGNGA